MKKLEEVIERTQACSKDWKEKAKQYLGQLTMPYWAMGDLLDLAVKMVSIQETLKVKTTNKKVFLFAADHGVASEGVSKYPQQVTQQMVLNFLNGGAVVNALAKLNRVAIQVVDMGVKFDFTHHYHEQFLNHKQGLGTENFLNGAAMTKKAAIECIEVGIQLVENNVTDVDVFIAGEMGIGNTTSSAAIMAAALGVSPEEAVGLGTGVDEAGRQLKERIIDAALTRHKESIDTPLGLLSAVGGFEIAAIVGMILGAARHKKIFVLDGFICSAAALIAHQLCPLSMQYVIAGHRSQEKGHQMILDYLRLKPLLNLNLRLGEGSGAVLCLSLLDAAVTLLNDVATFESAGVVQAK